MPTLDTIQVTRNCWDAAAPRTGYHRKVPGVVPARVLQTHAQLNLAKRARHTLICQTPPESPLPGPLVRIRIEGLKTPIFGYLLPTQTPS